ncbi:hypothetical protein SAMN02746089_01961 [Caldanaerobius fijiensis DSM 17918]|uniref:Uncharacterized protein n=1 Tax=Caldanaerobius fijiensis DSM 17918 TaxID=1121256 RepID=A0A1M5BW08_9THEO|nr:hypothetical protein [Caldanaerobius fijiensis]SHF46412.1 hypothetical protein SAMN02746089_01961 [Caldanaerobius fijiensis DSM 17918]
MAIRLSKFTNIKGKQVEFAADNITFDDRHFAREARSQKAQLQSVHKHGTNKGVKVPIHKKTT